MPLYAGICECDITPPPGLWMSGYAFRSRGARGVHDPLYGRALFLENGRERIALIASDLISLPPELVTRIRNEIADALGMRQEAIMLHCTHTHGGPYIGIFRGMGQHDPAYTEVLVRKLIGITLQAAESLQAATLIYGESSVQIGVNRRSHTSEGQTHLGASYLGPTAPTVQVLCVNSLDGRTLALLFCHACHPTTLGGDNLCFTAEWPGAAVTHLKQRFAKEGVENGFAEGALAFALQGCCGDINPLRRGSWEAMAANGRTVADAAHTARWNAHGRLSDTLAARVVTLELPVLPPLSLEQAQAAMRQWSETQERESAAQVDFGRQLFNAAHLQWAQAELAAAESGAAPQTVPFPIQHLHLGGIHILGFPAEMFVAYQRDFMQQSHQPVFALGYTNGCLNYLPTAAEYPHGGYEVTEAYKYYANPMFAPESEARVRTAVYELLQISDPDTLPYPSY